MILYEVDGEKTIEGLLEDMDTKAEEILLNVNDEIDEEDVYKLANMVQLFYNKFNKEAA